MRRMSCYIICLGSDWVDPDDPTVIAENELLGAAASIDAAAKKLESLRPRKSVQVQVCITIWTLHFFIYIDDNIQLKGR